MKEINDGGPAFPGEKEIRFGQEQDVNQGMSLRDYFAAHDIPVFFTCYTNDYDIAAKLAYKMADSLLKAREES